MNLKIQSLITKIIYVAIFVIIHFSCEYEEYERSEESKPLAECINGHAKFELNGVSYEYDCSGYELMGYVSLDEMDASSGNDCWGWTDPQTGKEYALMGLDNGTGIIDISSPKEPQYLGKIPTATVNSSWRDIKVYKDHAFVVSEADGHGLQIFDLTKLRGLESKQIHNPDVLYSGYGQAHNIAINEDSGRAYTAGARGKGLHILNISDPKNPILELEFPENGYTHDAQIINYKGPDSDHQGKEIFIGSNEDRVVFVDVSNKSEPLLLSTFFYDHQYTHQSWLTLDHKYLLMGDELDELSSNGELVNKTRTIIIDLSDLDNPVSHFDYIADTDAIDHNGYVNGSNFYLASYTSGLRVIDIVNISQKNIKEVGFFDTHNDHHHSGKPNPMLPRNSDPGDHEGKKGKNIEAFNGAWSVYPFFKSENIIISDINSGLFIVRKSSF